MKLADCLQPAFGIYAVRARSWTTTRSSPAMTASPSFGIRPMYRSRRRRCWKPFCSISTAISTASTWPSNFVAYLRPEAKLDSLEALKAQIAKDSDDAKKSLRRRASVLPRLRGGPAEPGRGCVTRQCIHGAPPPLRCARHLPRLAVEETDGGRPSHPLLEPHGDLQAGRNGFSGFFANLPPGFAPGVSPRSRRPG